MSRKTIVVALVLACAGLGLTGCMPHMTIEQMKAEMPKRPAELDRLDAFVGKWQFDGQVKFAMLDEPLKTSGTAQTEWAGNRWYLVSRGTQKMGTFDETQTLDTWTYDVHDKKYRSTWVNSMGMLATGEGTYNEKDKTWHMTATSYGPWGKSCMKGTLRFPNADTMEWSMEESMGLMKDMEMTGTGKRVK